MLNVDGLTTTMFNINLITNYTLTFNVFILYTTLVLLCINPFDGFIWKIKSKN